MTGKHESIYLSVILVLSRIDSFSASIIFTESADCSGDMTDFTDSPEIKSTK